MMGQTGTHQPQHQLSAALLWRLIRSLNRCNSHWNSRCRLLSALSPNPSGNCRSHSNHAKHCSNSASRKWDNSLRISRQNPNRRRTQNHKGPKQPRRQIPPKIHPKRNRPKQTPNPPNHRPISRQRNRFTGKNRKHQPSLPCKLAKPMNTRSHFFYSLATLFILS